MTLLVAQKQSNGSIWMIADTAITEGGIDLRQREYALKVFPVQKGRALAGFAGDLDRGLSAVLELDNLPESNPTAVISHLLDRRRGYEKLGFAYAWFDGEAHLVRIDDDRVEDVPVLYLGDKDAFSDFQRIRNDPALSHPPDAVCTMYIATRDPNFEPNEGLSETLSALWQLFSSRPEHDVGGWVTPYILTANGASLITYVYAASDPTICNLLPGDIIPHGTAAMGGFGFSLTELSDRTGIVAYWQQRSGGLIVRKARGGIESISIAGSPAEFKDKAKVIIGAPVDLWFGEEKVRRVVSTRDGLDAQGRPRFRILVHDDGSHALQWVQRSSEGSFAASLSIDLKNGKSVEPAADKPIIDHAGRNENKAKRMPTTFRLLFNAPLNTASVQALQQVIEKALNDENFHELQLVMSSLDGTHDAGFNLYGVIRSLPIPVHIHAPGVLARISVIAFLAGQRRSCTPTATFEFHPFSWAFNRPVSIADMQFAIDRMRRDSDLAKEVLRRHTQAKPEDIDRLFDTMPIILSSSEAVAMGLVHDILDLNGEAQHQENVRIVSISWQPHTG